MLTDCGENLFLGPLSRPASPQACSVSPRSGACPLSSQEPRFLHGVWGRTHVWRTPDTRVGVRRGAPALLEGSKTISCEALEEGRLRQALELRR